MDLNCLLHRHQAALIGAQAARAPADRAAWAETGRTVAVAIRARQRALGATFPLVGAAH